MNNNNISKMSDNDCSGNNYKPFNNNRNNKKDKKRNKVINITHNHYVGPVSKPEVKIPNSDFNYDINKDRIANEVIDRFSLNKPVSGITQDRFTPMFIAKSNNGSPVNFNGEVIHIIHPVEKKEEPPIIKPVESVNEEDFEEVLISNEIKHITDLIDLSNKNIIKPNVKYSIDLPKLKKIVPHLDDLNNMIGMDDIKKSLTNQLMYFLQGFEFKHMLHTIIEGPPGVGKTCLGKLLGQIYLELGCINGDIPNNQDFDDDDGPMNIKKLFTNILHPNGNNTQPKKFKFKIAKRSDLVGQYVGHTAVKTQKIINESFGGVLFIDEAYSLGGDDVFSKECINTINQNLSENGDKFICIIAGYADALENSFFSQNSGLHRRFPFRYKIEKYSGDELAKILKGKLQSEKYTVDTSLNLSKYIEDNKESFPNFGGDIETYFFHIKIMHSTRVFGKSIKLRNILIKEDFINALKEMKKHEKKEEKGSMYV